MMCTICNELSGVLDGNRFVSSNKFDMKNALIAKNEYFSLIPSVGALSNGHCLIVPNIHCNSILKYADENSLLPELNHFLIKAFNKLIIEKEVNLICFEHGSFTTEGDYSLCSTSHAHLHLIPIPREKVVPILAKVDGVYKAEVMDLPGLLKAVRKFTDYITIFSFYEGEVNNCKVLNAFNVPSQYIRKIIGNELGNKNWNWKTSQNNDFTNATIENYLLPAESLSNY